MDNEGRLSTELMNVDVQLLHQDKDKSAVQEMDIREAIARWKSAEATPSLNIEFPPVNFLNVAESKFGY